MTKRRKFAVDLFKDGASVGGITGIYGEAELDECIGRCGTHDPRVDRLIVAEVGVIGVRTFVRNGLTFVEAAP